MKLLVYLLFLMLGVSVYANHVLFVGMTKNWEAHMRTWIALDKCEQKGKK